MKPQLVLAILCLGSVTSFVAFCIIDQITRRLALASSLTALGLVIAAIIWRLPWHTHWFYGLEYEDAYIYTVAARQMILGAIPVLGPSDSPFLTTLCAVGSIVSCEGWETY